MTEKQMKAFLKKEGWEESKTSPGFWWDVDPSKNWPNSFEGAFRIASRRKRERETRRVKAAGYIYTTHYGWKRGPRDGYLSHGQGYFMTRSEALSTLEKP